MDPIIELLDTCEVTELATETIYKPLGSPPDRYIIRQLNISQGGAYYLHRALRRPGHPQAKGNA